MTVCGYTLAHPVYLSSLPHPPPLPPSSPPLLPPTPSPPSHSSDHDVEEVREINDGLHEMVCSFPAAPSNLLLRLIIGELYVTLPNKDDRYIYIGLAKPHHSQQDVGAACERLCIHCEVCIALCPRVSKKSCFFSGKAWV